LCIKADDDFDAAGDDDDDFDVAADDDFTGDMASDFSGADRGIVSGVDEDLSCGVNAVGVRSLDNFMVGDRGCISSGVFNECGALNGGTPISPRN